MSQPQQGPMFPPPQQPYARYGPVPPQQYMAGPQQAGRGYMVANGRVMGQQMNMTPQMNNPPPPQYPLPQNQRVLPRGTLPANPQQMPPMPSAYNNAGEQLMMVLNGGPYQTLRDFPALGNGQMGARGDSREFSMADSDFPALPTPAPSMPTQQTRKESGGPMMGHYPPQPQQGGMLPHYGRMPQGYPPQQQPQQMANATSSTSPSGMSNNNVLLGTAAGAGMNGSTGPGSARRGREETQYGLSGLLGLIRMTDRDLNTLALGTDLTTLGLNLNSTEPLYATFSSPWAENPVNKDPHHLPESYVVSNVNPPSAMVPLLGDETLLYAFYTSPKDVLQVQCARELYKRGWRYHKELQRWILKITGTEMRVTTPAYDRGPYFIYDPTTFEKVRNDNFLVVLEKLAVDN